MKGQLTNTISYTLEQLENGHYALSLHGTGPTPDFADVTQRPWDDVCQQISTVHIDDGITRVGDLSFRNFTALERLFFPPSVEYIGTHCCLDCPSLTEVVFSEGFAHVGSKAFQRNTSLKKLVFPSTLKTIDIKSFQKCPAITDVSFGGSQWQWEHYVVVDKSFSANDVVLDADIRFGFHPNAAADFDDVAANRADYDAIQLVYNRSLMVGEGRRFRPDDIAIARELFDALYLTAGADCLYGDSMGWAKQCLGLTPAADEAVTDTLVQDALNALARHNGYADAGLNAIPQGTLTRAQCAAALASFVDTPQANADRRTQMCDEIRTLIADGGDGKMHIIPVNLNQRGMPCKAGDCTLLILPQGGLMLIDCGYTGVYEKLLAFLREVGVKKLDYLVFSHCHLDHTGGADAVCAYIYEECGGTIDNFWYCGSNLDKTNIATITEYLAARGTIREDIAVDETGETEKPVVRMAQTVPVTFFGPTQADRQRTHENYIDENANNSSLVMRFNFGQSVYLTAGDLYESKEVYLLNTYGPEVFRATVMKANHHGNHTSNHVGWVEAVRPTLSFSDTDGCGSYNVRERLLERKIPYYSTGFDGLMHITMDDQGHCALRRQYDSNLRLAWDF